jgi:hypothetical protein
MLLASCAHVEAPPGGPADTRKPFVSAVQPAPDSTRVGRDLDARIRFSEWVSPDIERGKVYLIPPLAKRIRTHLDGDELRVTSSDRLDSNTTYTLGLLRTVKDLHDQPLEAPLELAFSTGPALDSGRLAGTVAPFQGRPAAGAMAALYPRGPELRGRFRHLTRRNDSTVVPAAQPDPAKELPAYIAPADSLGRFAFSHLRPGRYGLIGFQDANGDLAPAIGAEALAIGPSVDVASGAGEAVPLTLAAYDTMPMRLTEARWAQETMYQGRCLGTVRLKFSRPPHPAQALRREAYGLRKAGPDGKPAGAALPVLDVCANPVSGEIELSTLPLDRDSQYVASCAGLRDIYGNLADTARARALFKADTASRDTAKAEMIFLAPRKVSGERGRLPADHLMPGAGLTAYYPRLLTDSLQGWLRGHLQAKLDTTPLAFVLDRVSHHEFSLKFPAIPLKGQRLLFSLKTDSAATASAGTAAPGARPDSASAKATAGSSPAAPAGAAPVASFTLADAAKLGSLKFKQDRSAYGSRLVIRALGSPAEYSRITPAADDITVDSLPEGMYAVDYFRDTNGDGLWHPGSLAPWAVQEPYVQWADSAEVKAGAAGRGDGKPPGSRRAAPADSSMTEAATQAGTQAGTQGAAPAVIGAAQGAGIPERKLAWPPMW